MENQEISTFSRFTQWLRTSILVKLMAIGFLVLILMIPNAMIQDLVRERQSRLSSATEEVNRSWGGAQTITGPVLTIPYKSWSQTSDGKTIETRHVAHFLPQTLDIEGEINPETRKRGIYEIVLYQTTLQMRGTFSYPDWSSLHVDTSSVLWSEAKLSMGITSMAGIKNTLTLSWNEQDVALEPGVAKSLFFATGASHDVWINPAGQTNTFALQIVLNGSGGLSFEPVGKKTTVDLKSPWPSPSFGGSFLPERSDISTQGFSANWSVLDLNRNYPQQWKDDDVSVPTPGEHYFKSSAFGVDLMQTVDHYSKSTRSTKYAVLVIGLTFLIFFFFETLRKFHIHPFQYLLVGLALMVFYLLLLSLSEHIGFNLAYFSGAAATIALITVYSAGIIKVNRLVWQLLALLVLISGFIFVVLQLEDYALLAGSLGIFIALAAVMYFSRKVNWYNSGIAE